LRIDRAGDAQAHLQGEIALDESGHDSAIRPLGGENHVHSSRPALLRQARDERFEQLLLLAAAEDQVRKLVEDDDPIRHRRVSAALSEIFVSFRGELQIAAVHLGHRFLQKGDRRRQVGHDWPGEMPALRQRREGDGLGIDQEQPEIRRRISANQKCRHRFQKFAFPAAGDSRNQSVTGIRIGEIRHERLAIDTDADGKIKGRSQRREPGSHVAPENSLGCGLRQIDGDATRCGLNQRGRPQMKGDLQVFGAVRQGTHFHALARLDAISQELRPFRLSDHAHTELKIGVGFLDLVRRNVGPAHPLRR